MTLVLMMEDAPRLTYRKGSVRSLFLFFFLFLSLFLEADLQEGIRQVAAADIEEHVVGVRQTLGFNSVKFQCSMKKGQRRN